MLAVRVLERKEVIRFFGGALIVAPFMNFFLSIVQLPRADRWHSEVLWQALVHLPLPKKILAIAAVVIGIMMLNGSKAAWKYTMALVGGHLFFQILNFGQNVRESWLAIPTFLVNVGVLIFIADQLVWKQKTGPQLTASASAPQKRQTSSAVQRVVTPLQAKVQSAPKAQTFADHKIAPITPAANSAWSKTRKSVRVDFDGFGPWAKLISLSSKVIVMRSLVSDPPSMEGRTLEVALPGGALLKARFVKRAGDLFYFEAAKPESGEIAKINHWLKSSAA